jgi:hypothetical protein
MDTVKAIAAIDTAKQELDALTRTAFNTRRLNVVRTLDLASKALNKALSHVSHATDQNTKQAAADA